MAARRAVAASARRDSEDATARARRRVHLAKTALGERGQPWWETPSDAGRRARLAATVQALAAHRSPDRTICPSDAARAVGGDAWRSVMPLALEVIRELALDGQVEVLQRGVVLDPTAEWRGPIRVRAV